MKLVLLLLLLVMPHIDFVDTDAEMSKLRCLAPQRPKLTNGSAASGDKTVSASQQLKLLQVSQGDNIRCNSIEGKHA